MGISPEDERHLLNLSVIPAALVTYLLIVCFLFFGRNQQSLSLWYYITYFGIPFAIAVPVTIFLSFEVLYSRKVKQPISHGIKRFLGRVSLILMGVFTFGTILGTAYFALASFINQWTLLLLAGILWFAIWLLLVFRLREVFDKLYAGKW